MGTLNVLPPTVRLDPPGAPAPLEAPVDVTVGPVTFADGAAVTDQHVKRAGVFLYRIAASGAADDIWNEDAKAWQAPPADLTSLSPLPLGVKAGAPAPWQGVVIGLGQKDATGQERIAKATGGFPRYKLRALVETVRAGVSDVGLSAFSVEWQFSSAAESTRFAVSFDTPTTTPQQATRVRVQLKSAALVPAGFLEVRATGGNEVEIANCDGAGAPLARIRLTSAGEIRLSPAVGQRIVIEGVLETDEIYYQPSGGGGKRFLA